MSATFPTYDLAYGADPRQRLDVFPAAEPNQPVVVFWYGGGWQSGAKRYYRYMGRAIQRMGHTAVIADYRLTPQVRFPAFAEDGAAALAWTYQNIARYHGNPDRLFLMGHSAGAHTAAHLAYNGHWAETAKLPPSSLRGFIGISGPYDVHPGPRFQAAFDLSDPAQPWRPINVVEQPSVPALLLHGGLDRLVRAGNAVRMSERIRERGGRAETIIYPYLDHNFIVVTLARPFGFLPLSRDIARFITTHR